MRVFLEKSLTTRGWKGYVNDPDLNESFDINKGLKEARTFLRNVNKIGLPIATEAVSPLSPAVLRRPDHLDDHRSPLHRIANPPGNRFQFADAGCLQEWHQWLSRQRDQRNRRYTAAASLRHRRLPWPPLHGAYPRQPLRAPGAAWRRRTTELRFSQCPERRARNARMSGLLDNIVVDCSHARFRQARTAGLGPGERHRPDPRRESLADRSHARIESAGGKPEDIRRSPATGLWPLDHRPMHRLENTRRSFEGRPNRCAPCWKSE